MNRNKRVMPRKIDKAMEKAVRRAQTGIITPSPAVLSSQTSPKKILSRFPTRQARVDESRVLETRTSMRTQKAKANAKTSKRTTPGDVPRYADFSEPQVVHVEGARWIKTLVKQNRQQAKDFVRKGKRG